jgi:hypothetical protein
MWILHFPGSQDFQMILPQGKASNLRKKAWYADAAE